MKKRVNTKSDRISDLPEHLKQCILSLLDIRDAVRTSVLSKRWRHEWNWLPCLTFNRHCLPNEFQLRGVELSKRWKQIISQEKEAYLDFLERTLVRRCAKASNDLEKLSLFVPFSSPELASRVDRILACAVRCNVRKLTLDRSPAPMWYQLPNSVLAASSLTSLKLTSCYITSKYPNQIDLVSLSKISLFAVYVDRKTLKSIITGCPAIRKLSLVYCSGFKKLEISGVAKLEMVNLCDYTELERVNIDALHLQAFSIEGSNSPCQIDVTACKNIRRLVLNEVAMTDDQLSFHLDQLHLLEDLNLAKCDSLKHLKISGQTLKHLMIKHCSGLVKAYIDAPNLKSFSYWGSDVLSHFSLNACTLTSASINLSCRTRSGSWYVSFIQFLACFNSAAVTMSIASKKGVLITEDLRHILIPPLFNVKHMKMEVRNLIIGAHSLGEIVDSILWLCPRPDSITLSSILTVDAEELKFHFIYSKQNDSETTSRHDCCSLIPIECWRHHLKELKIENLTNAKYGANLMALFEKAEKLELIEGLFS